MNSDEIQIISFYEFVEMGNAEHLATVRGQLRELFTTTGIRGTIILAGEGYNGMVCGTPAAIAEFVPAANQILNTTLKYKSSTHTSAPLRRIDIKIKPEIVTLKREVDIDLGVGTHVGPEKWNELISDPDTVVLDTRNHYEFASGSFEGAIDPQIDKFSDLPDYIEQNLDPSKHKRVAMFCTGGIRCEKFAPYMKGLGFEEVYQLDGGILAYLDAVDEQDSRWRGECFVFDERITVNANLEKGSGEDHSQRIYKRKDPDYKVDR